MTSLGIAPTGMRMHSNLPIGTFRQKSVALMHIARVLSAEMVLLSSVFVGGDWVGGFGTCIMWVTDTVVTDCDSHTFGIFFQW